jgi:hypothetical protein
VLLYDHHGLGEARFVKSASDPMKEVLLCAGMRDGRLCANKNRNHGCLPESMLRNLNWTVLTAK